MAENEREWLEIRSARNPWKDAVLGAAAGVLGTVVMNRFWKVLAKVTPDRQQDGQARPGREHEGPLDDLSVGESYHRAEESATETAARVAYQKVSGEEPSKETRKALASEVHWATGMALGGLYGLIRGNAHNGLDLGGGLAFGTAAWFVNDELAVPMLGLSAGPTAHSLKDHASALGAHAAFGVATAAAAQVMEKIA